MKKSPGSDVHRTVYSCKNEEQEENGYSIKLS